MKSPRHTRAASALALALAFTAPAALCAEVAGVKVEDTVRSEQGELLLNGAGLRTKIVFKVYVAALYLPQKESNASAILQGKGPRRMVLRMMRNVDGDTLHEALDEGLRNNLGSAELDAIKAPLARLSEVFKALGKAREGDIIQLDISQAGLAIAVNGTPRGQIASEALGRGLLRVWLGEKPAEASLKSALLGQ
ncbi:chalcone isomerase family protein [Uliginosibacterium paludis]|uniref:Chalcone isomerase family protein n=1 Tax=Uliginosibacterium paludis TaxID=1615952 RepID=A0ABV2CT00_9RHOO